jgi:transposase
VPREGHAGCGERAGETGQPKGWHRAPVRLHHVVALGTKALDVVRRQVWQQLRRVDPDAAKKFKGARWSLLKNPTDLSTEQAATLRKLRRQGGALWRAYALKEALRAIFAGDLDENEVAELLDRFASKASRSGLKPFVTLAQTIRKRRDGILAAIRLGSEQRPARRTQRPASA